MGSLVHSGELKIKGPTKADILLIALLVGLGFYLVTYTKEYIRPTQVIIRGPNGWCKHYTLGEERIVSVPGRLGPSKIRIGRDFVEFVSSPCPHKLCIRRGKITKSHEWIACVPNQVVVELVGTNYYDAVIP